MRINYVPEPSQVHADSEQAYVQLDPNGPSSPVINMHSNTQLCILIQIGDVIVIIVILFIYLIVHNNETSKHAVKSLANRTCRIR